MRAGYTQAQACVCTCMRVHVGGCWEACSKQNLSLSNDSDSKRSKTQLGATTELKTLFSLKKTGLRQPGTHPYRPVHEQNYKQQQEQQEQLEQLQATGKTETTTSNRNHTNNKTQHENYSHLATDSPRGVAYVTLLSKGRSGGHIPQGSHLLRLTTLYTYWLANYAPRGLFASHSSGSVISHILSYKRKTYH